MHDRSLIALLQQRLFRWRATVRGGGRVRGASAARASRIDATLAAGVVRAAYVAVLEREPDSEGLRAHGERLQRGLPLEVLLAELAQARDAERTGAEPHTGVAGGNDASFVRELQRRVDDIEERATAERRTLLAVTRRLATLEDTMLKGSGADPPVPSVECIH